MALISIIIGLFLDRTFRHLHDLRDMTWFEFYAQAIQRFTGKLTPPIQFIVILALPVLLLLSIQILLNDFLLSVPAFVFGVIVFIYCLGPACLSTDIESYIHARTIGDEDEAMHYAGTITDSSASSSPDQQTSEVTRAILHVANERIFSTIFWFIVLGPFGAMLYRLISELSKQIEFDELADFSEFIHSIMAWIPARMLAAGYALTGNFDGAYHAYKDRTHSADYSQSNAEVLISTGLGAMQNLDMEDELAGIHASQALVMRAVIVWIGILAVLTLGGIFN
jgi:AmpE protein